jgi:hypothetical protein
MQPLLQVVKTEEAPRLESAKELRHLCRPVSVVTANSSCVNGVNVGKIELDRGCEEGVDRGRVERVGTALPITLVAGDHLNEVKFGVGGEVEGGRGGAGCGRRRNFGGRRGGRRWRRRRHKGDPPRKGYRLLAVDVLSFNGIYHCRPILKTDGVSEFHPPPEVAKGCPVILLGVAQYSSKEDGNEEGGGQEPHEAVAKTFEDEESPLDEGERMEPVVADQKGRGSIGGSWSGSRSRGGTIKGT